jgi:flagellar export protein FliJ
MVREARELQTVRAGNVDVDRILAAQRHEAVVTAELRHVEQQRVKVQEEIERRRAALVEADREVKTLEKLEASQRVEHRRREDVAEMKRMDETAGRRRSEEVDA